MKATFALLADIEAHNLVRKLSWEFHQKYKTGTRPGCLPPHISLKQPFGVTDLTALEGYMNRFARSIEPFEVSLTRLDVVPTYLTGVESGILWIDIHETYTLRQLHNRLNEELTQQFGDVPADFDGDAYHFHMTIMIGGPPIEVYRKFYKEVDKPTVDRSFTARELAMFLYEEPMGRDFLSYKILPIGHN